MALKQGIIPVTVTVMRVQKYAKGKIIVGIQQLSTPLDGWTQSLDNQEFLVTSFS